MDGAAVIADIVASPEVLDTLGLGFVDDPLAARWQLRVVVSLLLLMPGHDEAEERELIERYAPPLLATHV